MSILEDIFNFGINLLRGAIGSFGELVFEVYAGKFDFNYEPATSTHESPKITAKPQVKVLTFDNYRRTTRARYAKHELFNQQTQLEKVGDDTEQITLEIKLIRDLGVKPEELSKLIREYIRDGHSDFLIIGNTVVGTFVITEMQEQLETVDAFGRVLVSVLSVTFESYPAEEGKTAETKKRWWQL